MLHRSSIGPIVLAMAGLLVCCESVFAKVVRFEPTGTEFYGTFRSGDFVRIDGRIVGELAQEEPIPGLDRAVKNARGRVEYVTPIVIIAPKDGGSGNGALLFDVANRGRAVAHALYNSPRGRFLPLGSFEAGTGFLQDRGFTVVMAAWELGHKIELPRFTDSDGKVRYAEGVGLAAIRDIVDFLHHAAADEAGAPNPLAGTVNRTFAFGYSQTARLLKTMMIEGFDRVDGRRVFDGVHLQGGTSGLATILVAGTGPESSASPQGPRFNDVDFRGFNEEPFTYEDIVGRMIKRGELPPKIVVTNMSTDYFSIRASLARTGSRGTIEAPIPANVRVYDVSGASHVRDAQGCELPQGELDWSPVMRAVLVALDEWVSGNRPPPDNALMPIAPRPEDEAVLRAPAHLPNAVIQVPKQDADGNFVGGVRLPDVEVPLGTHGLQNRPLSSRPCDLVAAYIAFAKTSAERKPGDVRLSIAERYKGRADYLNRIRIATRTLIEQRFLLPEDGTIIIHAATQTSAFD
jgi:hypothetical protein